MTRDHLQQASEELEQAAQAADDGGVRDRLESQAEQFDDLATADRGPDHGRLARHTNALNEIQDEASSETVGDRVETALEHVVEYRKTVEGV